MEAHENATFTAIPSGGTENYVNYKWWKRLDYGFDPFSAENPIILAPPPGEWTYFPIYEGQSSAIFGDHRYNFSIKCEVEDSQGNKATRILGVEVLPEENLVEKNATINYAVEESIPQELTLFDNYPNPFNPETTIKFYLPKRNFVELKIYNINGLLINVLKSGHTMEGYHTAKWNGTDISGNKVSSGLYLSVLEIGQTRIVRRLFLLK